MPQINYTKIFLPISVVAACLLLARLYTKRNANREKEQQDIEVKKGDEDIHKSVLLAAECEPHLTSSRQKQYFAYLESQYEQIKRALEKCAAEGSTEYASYALRIIGSMYRFWFVTGRQHEGYNIAKNFDSFVKIYECTPINAKFYEALGFLAHAKGAFSEAEEHLSLALSFHTTLGNEFEAAVVGNQQGNCARERGDYKRAESLHLKALEIFTRLRNSWGLALAQNNLGVVARELGEWEKARKFFEESLQTRLKIGDDIGVASSYGNLGAVAFAQEDYAKAADFHTKCLNIRRKVNDTWGVAGAVNNLGLVKAEQNEFKKARELLTEAIQSFSKLQDKLGICEALEAFACLEAKEQKWTRSAILFGAAKERRRIINAHAPLSRKGHYDKHMKEVKDKIQPKEYERFDMQGTQMDFTQAVAYALA